MIDTDKYKGLIEDIDMIINAEEISVDDLLADCMVLKDGITELLAEVKRLREELEKVQQQCDKYSGALNLAIDWIGHTGMGMEYEERIKNDYGITVYGDKYGNEGEQE